LAAIAGRATSSAGECGVKDQVSRTRPVAKGEVTQTMEISFRSRNVEVPEAVRAAVTDKLSRLSKFLGGVDHAEVRFSEERNPRISEREVCEVTLHGGGRVVRAKASAAEPLTAVDKVVDKLEHRMEKLKGKLVGRSHPRRHASVDSAASQGVDRAYPNGAVTQADTEDADARDDGEITIVKTKQFAIKPMMPDEAALQMVLVGHDFFLFTNAETSRAAVVYRRSDGNVGLIDAT
jgi:putative sigma-54 modulation protein